MQISGPEIDQEEETRRYGYRHVLLMLALAYGRGVLLHDLLLACSLDPALGRCGLPGCRNVHSEALIHAFWRLIRPSAGFTW